MHRTHKVQVTLDERQYAAVSRISRAGGRKLAAVVREAVERYCVAPEARRRRDARPPAMLVEVGGRPVLVRLPI